MNSGVMYLKPLLPRACCFAGELLRRIKEEDFLDKRHDVVCRQAILRTPASARTPLPARLPAGRPAGVALTKRITARAV